MPSHDIQIKELDKKITALSDALAHLGKGTSLADLLKIIRNPGHTTPAELLFETAIVDSLHLHVNAISRLSTDLLAASKQVGERH